MRTRNAVLLIGFFAVLFAFLGIGEVYAQDETATEIFQEGMFGEYDVLQSMNDRQNMIMFFFAQQFDQMAAMLRTEAEERREAERAAASQIAALQKQVNELIMWLGGISAVGAGGTGTAVVRNRIKKKRNGNGGA